MAGSVTVRPMTIDEYDAWRPHSIASFAAEAAQATGQPVEAQVARAEAMYLELLPEGLDSEGNSLFAVVDEAGDVVGVLWLGAHPSGRPEAAYVYEIEIYQDYRGRGYGRAAMVAAEQVATEAGYAELGLNVFGFNDVARGLYESLGYRTVAITMTKPLA